MADSQVKERAERGRSNAGDPELVDSRGPWELHGGDLVGGQEENSSRAVGFDLEREPSQACPIRLTSLNLPQ
ncbi:hypothetical protein HPP92_009120 [Vanilla planifolia]|uniref:Uncharacterized protein n=1 Tax=Vanilla planifolia TaxID=51239 RepID=A0A835R7L5_VANPL|nr:hypothetical protein HPP92_009120 [Vanilla planifolia]